MNIIVEGPDRVGKDTLIKGLINSLLENSLVCGEKFPCCHTLHYSNVKLPDKACLDYSKTLYRDMFDMMIKNKDNRVLFFNRAHLGEAVYGPIYRGYSGDFVFDIEEDYKDLLDENTAVIGLYSKDWVTLWDRKDDKSLSGNNIELIEKENQMFRRAFDMSRLKNVYMIDVSDLLKEDVLNEALNYLNGIYRVKDLKGCK